MQVDYPVLPAAIATPIIKIHDKFYYIELLDYDRFLRQTAVLKDDEIFEPGVYTYIIGTTTTDINPHIWAKPAQSIQEITTKHSHILFDLQHDLRDKIDKILFAGELRITRRTVEYNFLSGTYTIVRCGSETEEQKTAVEDILKERLLKKFRFQIHFVNSCKTFIDHELSLDELRQMVAERLIRVKIFDLKADAIDYKNREIEIAKLVARQKFSQQASLQQEIDRLQNLNPEELMVGGKKRQRKTRRKTIKRRKTRR